MKKVLAIFLAALLICITLAPIGSAVSGPQLSTKVAEGKYSSSASPVAAVTKTRFTVVITAPKNVKKLVGVNLYFEFDPAVLNVVKAGLAGSVDDAGNELPNFSGLLVSGLKSGSTSEYALAWIPSGDGVSKNQASDLMYITFNVIDTTNAQSALRLCVDEFRTDDGNNDNDITVTDLKADTVINFNFPENTPPATMAPVEDGEAEDTEKVNELLQVIRDMLNGNGVTFADFADAIANTLGNAEITDIIEQLVDGNVDVSNGFIGILKSLGLDFSSFEELLNKIIDFIMGLFGGGDEGGDTEETTAAGGNTATTAKGSGSGSEQTGDVGVALAATVCVLSSAAFVLTRKKKEII
jgi:hypothetical protein